MSAASPKRTVSPPRLVGQSEKSESNRATRFEIPWRRVGIYAALALGFFLLGAIPMWLRARENAAEREVAQHELRLSQLDNRLMAAAIDARRGDYEPARQAASDFFTSLRNQIDRDVGSDLSANQRSNLKSLLGQRDEIITLLARNDPAAADRLANLQATYRKTMSDVPPPVESTSMEKILYPEELQSS